jgi:hypothetical protein
VTVRFPSPGVLAGALLTGVALLVFLIATRTVGAGVEWHYVRATTWWPLAAFAVIAAAYLTVAAVTSRLVDRHERAIVAMCLGAGVAVQLAIQSLARRSLGDWILQDHFNITARQHDVRDLLEHYSRIVPTLPLHAKANLPGKVLLFQGIRALTTSPQTIGYVVVALSAVGGVLLYLVTRELFGSKPIALNAMLLFFVLPAKSSFIASLNTVTPVFALGLLLVLLWYLRTNAPALLVALGLGLYACVLFEPSPLVLVPLAVLLVVRHAVLHPENAVQPVRMVVVPVTAFFAAHVVMVAAFGFDVFGALSHVSQDAQRFNGLIRPDYAEWLRPNLREFIVSAGIAVSLLSLVIAVEALAKLVARSATPREILVDPCAMLAVSLLGTVLVLDLAGINRGEVSRLWIFIAVLFAPVVSAACVTRLPKGWFHVLLACTLLQTVFTVRLVGFDFADIWDSVVQLPMHHDWTVVIDIYVVLLLGTVALGTVVQARRRTLRRGREAGGRAGDHAPRPSPADCGELQRPTSPT